jgi:hypothetical protein
MKTQRGRREDLPEELKHRHYQPTDVPPLPVVYAGLGLFAGICLAGVIVAGFLALYHHRAPPPALEPMEALALPRSAPSLQVFEPRDRAAVEAKADALLHRKEWVDRPAGRVRIPVEEAMRLLAAEGWPDKEDAP